MEILGRGSSGSELFGSKNATQILMVIEAFQTTHASEISLCTGISKRVVGHHLDKFELNGVVSRQTVGQNRIVSINSRFIAKEELSRLLKKLAQHNPGFLESISELRRRPRRKGKEIDANHQ